MVPLIITLLQWEFVVTTMVIFFSVYIFLLKLLYKRGDCPATGYFTLHSSRIDFFKETSNTDKKWIANDW